VHRELNLIGAIILDRTPYVATPWHLRRASAGRDGAVLQASRAFAALLDEAPVR